MTILPPCTRTPLIPRTGSCGISRVFSFQLGTIGYVDRFATTIPRIVSRTRLYTRLTTLKSGIAVPTMLAFPRIIFQPFRRLCLALLSIRPTEVLAVSIAPTGDQSCEPLAKGMMPSCAIEPCHDWLRSPRKSSTFMTVRDS